MNIEIANRLVELRKKSGLSQEELAAKLGLSRQAVSKWERAEASPDTDNLICLAKLYGVSLDDLLNTDQSVDEIVAEQAKDDGEEKQEEEPSPDSEGEDAKTQTDTTPKEETKTDGAAKDENKTGDQNKGKNKGEFHINSDGIFFKDADSEGSIDATGIHVVSADSEVHIDSSGIHVNDGVVCDADHLNKERARSHRYKVAESIVSSVVTLLCAATYLLCGFLIPDARLGWGACWIVFLLIPLAPTFISALKKRRFCVFAFPVLVTAVYLILGLVYGLWHPEWVIFLSIPVYYAVFGPIDEAIHRNLVKRGIVSEGKDSDEDEDSDEEKKKKDDAIDADVK